MMANRAMDILLVEDNPGDALLVREALRESGVPNNLHHAADGVEAMEMLRGNGSASLRPDIVLLDLNLPRKDGREVLAEMKHDPDLCRIPVVALTTSSADNDIEHCYESGVNAYIVKPVEFEAFLEVMGLFERFWMTTARLPRKVA